MSAPALMRRMRELAYSPAWTQVLSLVPVPEELSVPLGMWMFASVPEWTSSLHWIPTPVSTPVVRLLMVTHLTDQMIPSVPSIDQRIPPVHAKARVVSVAPGRVAPSTMASVRLAGAMRGADRRAMAERTGRHRMLIVLVRV